jgi:ABC-type uncharacterized transport system ATPase subunit
MESNQPLSEPLLRIENLCKAFGSVQANREITFDIRKGEVHCLLGENGAGKSTLSECLYGFYKPDTGRIYFKEKLLNLEFAKRCNSCWDRYGSPALYPGISHDGR